VLHSHYIEGYKVQEIAEQHGWTETAVRIRLLRARRSVEKKLAKPRHTKLRTLADKAREALTPGFNMQNLEAKVA
jgi:predicted DNA-binding protein YlxM (UPF0122 family)